MIPNAGSCSFHTHTPREFSFGPRNPQYSLTLLVLKLAPLCRHACLVPADAVPRFEEVSENENKCLYLNPYA